MPPSSCPLSFLFPRVLTSPLSCSAFPFISSLCPVTSFSSVFLHPVITFLSLQTPSEISPLRPVFHSFPPPLFFYVCNPTSLFFHSFFPLCLRPFLHISKVSCPVTYSVLISSPLQCPYLLLPLSITGPCFLFSLHLPSTSALLFAFSFRLFTRLYSFLCPYILSSSSLGSVVWNSSVLALKLAAVPR